jgi:hypothetical protein
MVWGGHVHMLSRHLCVLVHIPFWSFICLFITTYVCVTFDLMECGGLCAGLQHLNDRFKYAFVWVAIVVRLGVSFVCL